MEVHNVPEAIDTNTSAEIGKSETFTEYHGISGFLGRHFIARRRGIFVKKYFVDYDNFRKSSFGIV